MSARRLGKKSIAELFILAVALIAGGTAFLWWTWNAPAPQSEPGPGQELLTVEVLGLADEVISSSITMSKPHRVSYAYTVDGRAYCADGRAVDPGADAGSVCAERLIEIGRGTYDALDAMERDPRQLRIIYDAGDPWRSFPVETREPPLRRTLIGLGLAAAGTLLFIFGVTRLRGRSGAG